MRAVERLAETEYGEVKRVRGLAEVWRLRVGDLRVFFACEFAEGAIRVLGVRHRREAYR